MGRLQDEVAVVTGGASGIGLATVERLGEQGAGVHYRGREKGGPQDEWAIADLLGASARFVPADVTDDDQLAEVIDTAVRAFGGLDIICPGGIVTPIIHSNPALGTDIDPDLLRVGLAAGQPLPRAGEPSDVAATALWLASDDSSFVTGQAIAVDGGLSCEADSRMRGMSLTGSLQGS